jgi:hypothetical protein
MSVDKDYSAIFAEHAEDVPQPAVTGAWCTIEFQPDVFAPQRFTIGVALQSAGHRLHFKLIDDPRKFECVYGDHLPLTRIKELLSAAEQTLRGAVQNKGDLSGVMFGTSALSVSPLLFTSWDDEEVTLNRLYREVVAMHSPPNKREKLGITTSAARDLVNGYLKNFAKLDFDRIVHQSKLGVPVEEADGTVHFLDLNLTPPKAIGSVTSAAYIAESSITLNLLQVSRDLTTYARAKKMDEVGLFLLLPAPDSVPAKVLRRTEEIIAENEWKLQKDGFRVVSLDSPQELAQEIYSWAQPLL